MRDDTTTPFLIFLSLSSRSGSFSFSSSFFVPGASFCMILEFRASLVQGVRKVESGPAHGGRKQSIYIFTSFCCCFPSLFLVLLIVLLCNDGGRWLVEYR